MKFYDTVVDKDAAIRIVHAMKNIYPDVQFSITPARPLFVEGKFNSTGIITGYNIDGPVFYKDSNTPVISKDAIII